MTTVRITGDGPLIDPAPTPDLVLMLTDTLELDDVAVLSTRCPTLYSVKFRSEGTMRGMIATENQLSRLRDQIDRAIARARDLDPKVVVR